jgi:hypothetical protein
VLKGHILKRDTIFFICNLNSGLMSSAVFLFHCNLYVSLDWISLRACVGWKWIWSFNFFVCVHFCIYKVNVLFINISFPFCLIILSSSFDSYIQDASFLSDSFSLYITLSYLFVWYGNAPVQHGRTRIVEGNSFLFIGTYIYMQEVKEC